MCVCVCVCVLDYQNRNQSLPVVADNLKMGSIHIFMTEKFEVDSMALIFSANNDQVIATSGSGHYTAFFHHSLLSYFKYQDKSIFRPVSYT